MRWTQSISITATLAVRRDKKGTPSTYPCIVMIILQAEEVV